MQQNAYSTCSCTSSDLFHTDHAPIHLTWTCLLKFKGRWTVTRQTNLGAFPYCPDNPRLPLSWWQISEFMNSCWMSYKNPTRQPCQSWEQQHLYIQLEQFICWFLGLFKGLIVFKLYSKMEEKNSNNVKLSNARQKEATHVSTWESVSLASFTKKITFTVVSNS